MSQEDKNQSDIINQDIKPENLETHGFVAPSEYRREDIPEASESEEIKDMPIENGEE